MVVHGFGVADPWGYYLRNCTSFVAWLLHKRGVPAKYYEGLHAGGQWYANAKKRHGRKPGYPSVGTKPAVGAAAVNPGHPGHVAYVSAVHKDGTITVKEFNHHLDGRGDTWTGKPGVRGFTRYVYFQATPTRPSVSQVSPASGSVSGGARVTVTGQHFTGATRVAFGSTLGKKLTVVSGRKIRVTTPQHAAGTVHVRVTAKGQTSAKHRTDRFTFAKAGLCATQSKIPASECRALVDLYKQTDGPEWTHHDGWKTSANPCTWWGVSCGSGHVKYVELLHNGLQGAVPKSIGNLTKLYDLDLESNELTGIPAQIGNLTNLAWLYLGGNELTSVPTALGNLTRLDTLGLEDNKLTSVPASLWNLTNLIALSLAGNQLTSVATELGNLTRLQDLGLRGNQLTSVPSTLGNLTKLQYLDLSHNQLTSIPSTVGNLTELGDLYLGYNQLNIVPAQIGNLTNLHWLLLGRNQLTGDITPWAKPLSQAHAMARLELSDGPGGNNCLTADSDQDAAAWLTTMDPPWDECD